MSTVWPFAGIEYKYDVYRGVGFTNKLIIKAIIKLMAIAIILVNTAVMHIAYVIKKVVFLRKFLWFFTIDWTVVIILSS